MSGEIFYDPEYTGDLNETWTCNVCKAQNSPLDGECQFCECEGLQCRRDNCSDPDHFGPKCENCQEEQVGKEEEAGKFHWLKYCWKCMAVIYPHS